MSGGVKAIPFFQFFIFRFSCVFPTAVWRILSLYCRRSLHINTRTNAMEIRCESVQNWMRKKSKHKRAHINANEKWNEQKMSTQKQFRMLFSNWEKKNDEKNKEEWSRGKMRAIEKPVNYSFYCHFYCVMRWYSWIAVVEMSAYLLSRSTLDVSQSVLRLRCVCGLCLPHRLAVILIYSSFGWSSASGLTTISGIHGNKDLAMGQPKRSFSL